jgi:cyclomaltodextrinase / maltogenic alpha-amylase / neopullulanase
VAASLTDTPDWVRDAVFYQIFPDRFAPSERVVKPGPLEPWDTPPTNHGYKGGDLLGIVEHLDYLADLGINALYLTPVFSSASNHRYHTYDYFAVDPLLGGNGALRELIDACHTRDMHIVLDGVFNHSGRGFWPFHHVVENGISSPYRDWFYVDHERLAAGGWLRPYPTDREREMLDTAASTHSQRQGDVSLRYLGYRAWWDLPALPKLNTDNPQMREHLMGAAEHWLRFGIDGWRLDVAEEIDAGYWREFRARCRAINPDAYIVAEIWREKPEWLTGDTFDALMNYPLTEAILSFVAAPVLDMEVVATQHEYRQFVRPIDGPGFAELLSHLVTKAYRPPATAVQLNLLGSHDTARFLTVAGRDKASLRLAMLAVMTLPGAPCIYYGDEIGMEGRHDPDCRRAFPWSESAWDKDLLAFVRAAAQLRHAQPVLRRGDFAALAAEGDAVAYARSMDGVPTAVVALNAGTDAAALSFGLHGPSVSKVQPATPLLAASAAASIDSVEGTVTVELGPRSGAVFLVS